MANVVGSGDYRYEVVEDWAQLPEGWDAPMAAVAVDSQDRVYGFNRGEHRVIVFDRDGNFLQSWGEGQFPFPHAIYADPDDNTVQSLFFYIWNRQGKLTIEQDFHVTSLYPIATWERLMSEAGFRVEKRPYPVHEDGRDSYMLVGVT